MKQTTNITYTVKEIYDYISSSFYDIHVYDECGDLSEGLVLFESLSSPDAFIKNLKDGFSPCILPHFDLIEQLVRSKVEFIITVYKKDKLWAVVNGSDINF
jgi:hypothetical protein